MKAPDRQCRAHQGHRQPLRLGGACATPIPTPTSTCASRSNTASTARRSSTTCYKGFATMGNDTTVAPSQKYYAKDLPQRPYDPDKAAFHFKKAGMANAKSELQVSEGAFSGATDSAVLYQEAMKKAGIDAQRQARLRRRLLEQRLAEGSRSARSIGAAVRPPTTSSRRPSSRPPTGTTRIGRAPSSTSCIVRGARRTRRGQAHAALRRMPEDDLATTAAWSASPSATISTATPRR